MSKDADRLRSGFFCLSTGPATCDPHCHPILYIWTSLTPCDRLSFECVVLSPHFSAPLSIALPVSGFYILVGNRVAGLQKHKISQDCSMENPNTHFLWIGHGLRIEMSPEKP